MKDIIQAIHLHYYTSKAAYKDTSLCIIIHIIKYADYLGYRSILYNQCL